MFILWSKERGIALGLLGGVGLVILVFIFNLPPGKPPVDVMLVIIAVVSASATLQASGGLDVMLQIAEKLLEKIRSIFLLLHLSLPVP